MDNDPGYEFVVPVCMCGRPIGELCDRVGKSFAGPRHTGQVFRFSCFSCRDVLRDFWFRRSVPRRQLLVIQTLDLDTGEVDSNRVELFKDHEPGVRFGNRGGERLEPQFLEEALRRRTEQARRGPGGQE